MKKFISIFLALIVLSMAPLAPMAHAQELTQYGPIRVNVPLDMELLEKHFREYVKDAAKYYFTFLKNGETADGSKYYYEASDLKAAFDVKNRDLAFNTQENSSKRDYEQENRELILYMLSQDIQNKADELKALSPAQKEAFYPGMMFDPATGDLVVNKQAFLSQEQYDDTVAEKIETGCADACMLFVDSAIDVGMGIGGVANKEAYDWTSLVTELLGKIWKYQIQMNYEEERKAKKNAYRSAMIESVKAAQQNVDDRMFEGLYALRDDLKRKKEEDTETQLLIDGLDQLLEAVEKTRDVQSVLSYSAGGETVEQAIDRIAEELVNESGMTVQEMRSKMDMFLEMFEYSVTEAMTDIAFELIQIPEDETSAIDEVVDTVKSIVKDIFAGVKNSMLNSANSITWENLYESVIKNTIDQLAEQLGEKLVDDYFQEQISFWKQQVKDAEKTKKKALDIYSRDINGRSKKKANEARRNKQIAETDLKKQQDTLKEWEEQAKNNVFGALVEDCVNLVDSTLDLAQTTASMGDSFDNEVAISYGAGAMYHAKNLAEQERQNVQLKYGHLANSSAVDSADLGELRDFLNSVYVVLNTDMLGQSYYASLCATQEYQQDPDELDRHLTEVNELLDEKKQNAKEQGGFVEAGYNFFELYYKAIGLTTAFALTSDSEYLKKVQKESSLGSWLSSDSAVSIYNNMADLLEEKYELPALYDPLFTGN